MSSLKLVEPPAPQPILSESHLRQAITAKAALQELFELLEDYSPLWYTEEHHDRAVKALRGY